MEATKLGDRTSISSPSHRRLCVFGTHISGRNSFLDSAMAGLQIGAPVEVAQQGSSNGRNRKKGRAMNVGHSSEDVSPTHFCKVLIAPGLGFLPIPTASRPYLHQVPDTITLKTITGCMWDINITDINGRACLDQGWAAFAIAHNLKIGYFLTFKKMKAKVYKVVIFYYSCTKVIERCPDQTEALKRYVDEE